MLKPYQVPLPADKHSRGKQPFLHQNFCGVCGLKRNVTWSYYTDPVTNRRQSGYLCADCYSVVTEAEHETEPEQPDAERGA